MSFNLDFKIIIIIIIVVVIVTIIIANSSRFSIETSIFLPVLVLKHTSFHVLPNAWCHGSANAAKWESSLGICSSCLMSGAVFPSGLLSLAATKQRGRGSAAPLLPVTSAAD